MESPEFQAKSCVICGENITLADRIFSAGTHFISGEGQRGRPPSPDGPRKAYIWTPKRFFSEGVCCSQHCSNELEQMSRELRYPVFDRDKLLSLIRDFRISLGLEEGDTPTTFKPWDLIKITKKNGGRATNEKHPVIETSEYAQSPQWRALVDYVFSLKQTDRNNLLGRKSYSPKNSFVNKDYTLKNHRFFLRLVRHVSKDEFLNAPLWALPAGAKTALSKEEGMDIYEQFDDRDLFEKMKELYPNGMTHEDYVSFTDHQTYVRLSQRYWWYPRIFMKSNKSALKLREKYPSYWQFIVRLQRYMNRDENGRFLPVKFKRVDYLVHKNNCHDKRGMEWTRKDVRDWVLEYVFPTLQVTVNRQNFPDSSTEEELQQVINLTIHDLEMVPAYYRVTELLREKQEDSGAGIKKIIMYAWNKYKMNQTAWGRAYASEKRGNEMLERVFKYHGLDGYVHGPTTSILVGKGKKVRYPAPSNAPIKIDGRLGRTLAVEFQGCYHYVDRHAMCEDGDYDETIYLQGDIPASMLDYCMENGIDTPLKYRKYLDRQCRLACEENGYGTPIYIILSKYAYAVDGVHGDIPRWNRRYVNTPNCRYKNQIGLAETFDMQGREDIGDMIREYYHNVIEEEE